MTLLFSQQFAGKSEIRIASRLDGDFSSITVKGRVSSDDGPLTGVGPSLLAQLSNDDGATFLAEAYSYLIRAAWTPVSNAVFEGYTTGVQLTNNMVRGSVWTFELTLEDPNDFRGSVVKPEHAKHYDINSIGLGGPGTGFIYSRIGQGSYLLEMVNALRIIADQGNHFSGWIEVTGEPRVDTFPTDSLYKVACFGPSTTGYGGWPEALEAQLKPLHTSKNIVVRNFGRNGQASIYGVMNIGNVIACNPNAVVLDFALADGFQTITSTVKERNRDIINQLRTALPGVAIYLLTSNPFYGQAGIDHPSIPVAYQMYRDLAAEESVHLVDTFPLWPTTGSPPFPTQNSNDGVHPTVGANLLYLVPTLVAAVSAGVT